MDNNRERQRLQTLFQDLEKIAADPASKPSEIKQDIEDLRARLLELEKQILEKDEQDDNAASPIVAADTQKRSLQFSLYEKDRLGYMYTNEKLEELQNPNPTLSGMENILTSPLKISGQAVGEMQITSPNDRQLTTDEISLTNAVAQQVSLQIQNLRLLSEAERSKVEAEGATRRFIHEGWDSYLDAIQRDERVGFTYDQSSVLPYVEGLQANGGIQATVKVMDEQVGTLYVEPDPNQPMSDSDKALISAVADQVAQQVENIRLLADASRARAEAEEAIRSLTRENWTKFAEDKVESDLNFVYDSIRVTPIDEASLPQDIVLSQPLMVRGEEVGKLSVAGRKQISPEEARMAAAIAAQTSIHLETLRLTDELQKRARELKELDRLKSAFLANMSHELRTPLNSILGFTDVMLEGLDGKLTDYMDNDLRLIQKNGQHLLHLINDVLDMAKIESGRMNLHLEKFTVQSILEEVTSITSTLASEKNLALFIDETSDQEIEIFADNTRVRQVMINLVNNAIKFTEKGKIALSAHPMDGARVLITVKDTGLGIPPDKLEAVFQEFTQVDTSTTRKVGGTGLGLPISRRLVEMHGGRLWAESTGVNGEGSTFHVEMPLEARVTEVIEKQEK